MEVVNGVLVPLLETLLPLIQEELVGTLNIKKGLEDIMKMERDSHVMENVEKWVLQDMFLSSLDKRS